MRMAELDLETNSVRGIGDNQPPGPLDSAKDALADLSAFLSEHPVISNENEARSAKTFVDRIRATLGDLETERVKETKPLNDRLTAINGLYKAATKPLTTLYDELKARLTSYAIAEERKRAAEAERLRREAELAEMNARLAEQAEADAIANAAVGEAGIDLGIVTLKADQSFEAYKQLGRAANRAERSVPARIGGGFSGRALAPRTVEILVVSDPVKAIQAIGENEKIRDAILSAAREFRKRTGALPEGVTAETTRKI